jgi:hypothetical protein
MRCSRIQKNQNPTEKALVFGDKIMAKSKPLPSAELTSGIIRAGVRIPSEENLMRHARLISRAALYLSGTALVEKVISVPEGQLSKLQGLLRHYDLFGFSCAPKPDGLNLGDGQAYNERKLIENPGQILLVDADFGFCIENPRASYKLTPEQFGAEFSDASQLAALNNVRLWGFCYRQTQGYYIGRQGMHTSVGDRVLDGFVRSRVKGKLAGFFIRNLLVCHQKAKGNWGHAPLLEDLYRCLSEYTQNPASLGRYYGTRVRFPDERTNKNYHTLADWREGERMIRRDFGPLVAQFPDVFKRRHKTSE